MYATVARALPQVTHLVVLRSALLLKMFNHRRVDPRLAVHLLRVAIRALFNAWWANGPTGNANVDGYRAKDDGAISGGGGGASRVCRKTSDTVGMKEWSGGGRLTSSYSTSKYPSLCTLVTLAAKNIPSCHFTSTRSLTANTRESGTTARLLRWAPTDRGAALEGELARSVRRPRPRGFPHVCAWIEQGMRRAV